MVEKDKDLETITRDSYSVIRKIVRSNPAKPIDVIKRELKISRAEAREVHELYEGMQSKGMSFWKKLGVVAALGTAGFGLWYMNYTPNVKSKSILNEVDKYIEENIVDDSETHKVGEVITFGRVINTGLEAVPDAQYKYALAKMYAILKEYVAPDGTSLMDSVKIDGVQFATRQCFFAPLEKSVDEVRARAVVSDFFNFFDDPRIKEPEYKISIPKNATELRASKEGKVQVFACKDVGYMYTITLNVFSDTGKRMDVPTFRIPQLYGGYVESSSSVEGGEWGKRDLVFYEANNPYENLDHIAMASELLHVSVGQHMQALKDAARQNVGASDLPEDEKRKLRIQFSQVYSKFEEGFVHGLQLHYMQKNKNKYPEIPDMEFSYELRFSHSSYYDRMSDCLKFIETKGLRETCDDFFNFKP